jgi:sugar diacid utilization regulator
MHRLPTRTRVPATGGPPAALSRPLQRIVRSLRADSPALSDRMLGTLRQTIPEYNNLPTEIARDVYDAGVRNAELWYDALSACRMPPPDALAWVAAFGRRRCEQGVSLAALLHAYRVGTRVYLDTLIGRVRSDAAVSHEVLLTVSPFVLGYGDLLSQTLSEVYREHRLDESPHRERLREDLFGLVCHQPQLSGAFTEGARLLGLEPDAPHHAVLLKPPGTHQLDVLRDALRTARAAEGEPLHGVLGDALVAWLRCPGDETPAARERRLADTLGPLFGADATLAGVGEPAVGAAGWHRSLDQAVQAVALGRRLRPAAWLHFYSAVALDDTVRASPEMAASLDALLERLSPEPMLLHTLAMYFEQRQQLKAVAAALGIHRNTLLHRLDRVRNLLQADLADVDVLARLHLALRQRRLRSPPH